MTELGTCFPMDAKQEAERRAFAAALQAHLANCEQCSGPDDGCQLGQEIECFCIDGLGFNPWNETESRDMQDKNTAALEAARDKLVELISQEGAGCLACSRTADRDVVALANALVSVVAQLRAADAA